RTGTEVVARRRVGCKGSVGMVHRRRLMINNTWFDGRDGAVKGGGDTGIGGRSRGLGSASPMARSTEG
ncbi:hypothetical protein U1Q18_022711, partial [Sarracenia purpurea var. burkii]